MVDDELITLEFGRGKAKGKIMDKEGIDMKPLCVEQENRIFPSTTIFHTIYLPNMTSSSNTHFMAWHRFECSYSCFFHFSLALSLSPYHSEATYIDAHYIDRTLLHIHVQFNCLNISTWWFRKVFFFIAYSFFCILAPFPRTFCAVFLYL